MKTLALLVLATMLTAQSAPQAVQEDTTTQSAIAPVREDSLQQEGIVPKPTDTSQSTGFSMRDYIWAFTTLLTTLFGIYQYVRRKRSEKDRELGRLEAKDEHREKEQRQKTLTAEESYRKAVREELDRIGIFGSPQIATLPLSLIDCFVNLDLSEHFRGEQATVLDEKREAIPRKKDYPPEEAIKRALHIYKTRLLLIIGDPGSGKTTLLKYYALKCLDNKARDLGFTGDRLPVFLSLRNVDPEQTVAENLFQRYKATLRGLTQEEVDRWLREREPLILLDGLDEVSDIDKRITMCRWIEEQNRVYSQAFFAVTSRWTGYRKADGVELEVKHLRADVRDFSSEQQEDFLRKWFRAVYLHEDLPEQPDASWRQEREKQAEEKVNTIIDYLASKENKSVRELAVIPMLLQIMAIIWKEQEYLPRSRGTLYGAAVDYLLEHRDRRRKLLKLLLPAAEARAVLGPVALWMQDERIDDVEKEALHEKLQPGLDEATAQPRAVVFCRNLIDRAGLLAPYGQDRYIFRHKSFREYLAGMQLVEEFQNPDRMQQLVAVFGDDWWQETLLFFISSPNARLFDAFMRALFAAPLSHNLDDTQRRLLRQMAREAGLRKIDALVEHLHAEDSSADQQLAILDCLKTIGTDQALHAVRAFAEQGKAPAKVLEKAHEIVAEYLPEDAEKTIARAVEFRFGRSKSFLNAVEYNAEYILIPGGRYVYQRGKKLKRKVEVPDIYFAKYPVTNRRYRRFIRYLRGEEPELQEQMPKQDFSARLLDFAGTIEEYREYLGDDPAAWAEKLMSKRNDDRKFNGEDKPVVGVSWFDARAYCFWLSLLAPEQGREFRLPHETEWEWAASGGERKYPWGDRPEPNEKLANFDRNVGQTTPVGQYPKGATPEGLLDTAGNVWEWQENLYDKGKRPRSLRGGYWLNDPEFLACALRIRSLPDDWSYDYGFRVVCAQS